jgi:competence protein ComEC
VVVVRASADPAACPGKLVLTAEQFRRGGAVELYRQDGAWRAVWAQDLRGRRPWTWWYGI